MPDKEPVQPDADPATTESILKELGIEGEDAQSPGARRCAQMLAEQRRELDQLTRKSAEHFREWNIGTNGGKGYDTEMTG